MVVEVPMMVVVAGSWGRKRERWEKLKRGEERGGDREREFRERLEVEGREGENLGEEGGGAGDH